MPSRARAPGLHSAARRSTSVAAQSEAVRSAPPPADAPGVFSLARNHLDLMDTGVPVPMRVVEKVAGAASARSEGAVAIPIRVQTDDGKGAEGELRNTTYQGERCRWRIFRLSSWLKTSGAAPGDRLQLSAAKSDRDSAKKPQPLALTISLHKGEAAEEAAPVAAAVAAVAPDPPLSAADVQRVPHELSYGWSALYGRLAIRGAYPQAAAAADAGEPQVPVELWGKRADGTALPYSMMLHYDETSKKLLLQGEEPLVEDLAIPPGSSITLWCLPGDRVVAELCHDTANRILRLTDRRLRSDIDVPMGVIDSLLGAERGRESNVRIPVRRLDEQQGAQQPAGKGQAGKAQQQQQQHAPGEDACLRANAGSKWFLSGLVAWLKAVDAAPGDGLQLTLTGGKGGEGEALTVTLIRAATEAHALVSTLRFAAPSSSGSDSDTGDGGAAFGGPLLFRKGELHGRVAIRRAFSQHLHDAQEKGSWPVQVVTRGADGELKQHKVSLRCYDALSHFRLTGVGLLGKELGVTNGSRVALSALPDGQILAEAVPAAAAAKA